MLQSDNASVQPTRPEQEWGNGEIDPVLLEWIVALDLCSSRRRGGGKLRDCHRKEALRHNLALIVPVVIDSVGQGGGLSELQFNLHKRVPGATAAEGERVLQDVLGLQPDRHSAVHQTLKEAVARVSHFGMLRGKYISHASASFAPP
jgi:hypothetical protein